MRVFVILALHHKPQCEIEGTKEKGTWARVRARTRAYIKIRLVVGITFSTQLRICNFIGAGHNFCCVGRLPLE
jgi:hypothetical protein